MKINKRKIALLFILGMSLFIRLSYVLTVDIDNPIRGDAVKYGRMAFNLIENGVYSHVVDATEHNSFITPGYPLFLVAITKISPNSSITYHLILITQALLSALTVGLVFLIGLRFMPLAWASVVAVFAAISPHAITFSGYILTETLFTFLLVLSIYLATLFWHRKTVLLALLFALTCVLASFVRPAFLIFPLFLIGAFFWSSAFVKNRFRLTAAILLVVVVFWAPWQVWQSKHQELGGPNLFLSALALGSYPELIYETPELKGFPDKEDPEWKAISTDLKASVQAISQRASQEPFKYLYWYTLGKPKMFFDWSILVGQGGPFMFPIKSSIYNHSWLAEQTLVITSLLHPIWVVLTLLLGGVMLVQCVRRHSLTESDQYAVPTLLATAYFALIHTILAPLPRYSIPLHPLIFLCAIYMLYKIFVFITKNRDTHDLA